MCTALHLEMGEGLFGRTLDVHEGYGERICITPCHFPLKWRFQETETSHLAIIGMATVSEGVPLYFDAVNEAGLAMAGLRFPGNTWYFPPSHAWRNVASFELIPYVLAKCKTVREARKLLEGMRVVNVPFREDMPPEPLHWMIADKHKSIVVESLKEGLCVYDNDSGVLTNNPPFAVQSFQVAPYAGLTATQPEEIGYESFGLGGWGLPGDLSSVSRFVRLHFHRRFSVSEKEERPAVGQFFHLLSTVEVPKGSCRTADGQIKYTRYSCCMSLSDGRYYYSTYFNRQLSCVDMHRVDLQGDVLTVYSPVEEQQIFYQN